MHTENYMPKTMREQIFYIIGMLKGMEKDENGCVNINCDRLIEQLTIATEIGYENNIPLVNYREVGLAELTNVTSTNCHTDNSGCSDRPPFEFETGSVFSSL